MPPAQVIISSLKDAAQLLRHEEDLFRQKVKQVVIQGGVEPFTPGGATSSESEFLLLRHGAQQPVRRRRFAYFYERCQQIGIPLIVLSRFAAYSCPVPRAIYDDMAATGSKIGEHLQLVQVASDSAAGSLPRSLACSRTIRACTATLTAIPVRPLAGHDDREAVEAGVCGGGSAARQGLPIRCNKSWFCNTFLGGNGLERSASDRIWDLVCTFNMYDPLALLAAIPQLRCYFDYSEFTVGGVCHRVVGISKEQNGVRGVVDGKLCMTQYMYDAFMEGITLGVKKEVDQ